MKRQRGEITTAIAALLVVAVGFAATAFRLESGFKAACEEAGGDWYEATDPNRPAGVIGAGCTELPPGLPR